MTRSLSSVVTTYRHSTMSDSQDQSTSLSRALARASSAVLSLSGSHVSTDAVLGAAVVSTGAIAAAVAAAEPGAAVGVDTVCHFAPVGEFFDANLGIATQVMDAVVASL